MAGRSEQATVKRNQPATGRFPRTFLAVAISSMIVAGACGGSETADDGAEPASKTKGAADTVTMRLIAFKPGNIEVKKGATVTWVQKDAGAHTVTSGTVEQGGGGVTERPDDKFHSGDIATGKTFEFTFPEAGTYPYFCAIHPATMRGEVRVS